MKKSSIQILWLFGMIAIAGLLWIEKGAMAQGRSPLDTGEAIVLYNAVLRDGPGSVFPIVDRVDAGDTVVVVALSDDGYWAQLTNGNWIAAVLIDVVSNEGPSEQTTAETAQRLLIPTRASTITATQPITMTLLDGSPFLTAFHAALITPAVAPLLRPTATAAPNVQPLALRSANVRRGPGTNYAVIGGVGSGDSLEIIGQTSDGTWLQLRDGSWIAAFLVDLPPAPLPTVAPAIIAALPTAAPTATPSPEPSTATADPSSAAVVSGPLLPTVEQSVPTGNTTFVITRRRLWNAWENGGSMDGPSVHCGQGRNLTVNVLDENGNRLNGVAVQVEYGAKEIYVTGAQGKGDGIVEFVLGSGQDVKVIRDNDGSPANSEVATGLVTDPRYIDFPTLRDAGYCQDDDHCRTYASNLSCIGHYSWTVTFERRQ